ncbi:MAG TPA: type II toxin-antitoxin system HipA family toxin [Bacteroidales bacterium]|nr:type II toxin-antitoxin system HipA family toxin [Bacteroidales bacterium]
MESILEVTIWGKKVGVLAWDKSNDLGVFEFYDTFASFNLDLAPLTMPRDVVFGGDRIFSFPEHRVKTYKGLPGMLADSLPDDYGNAIIDEYFASRGFESVEITPVDRLCYVGSRGMGALEFHPAWDVKQLNSSSVIELGHLTALAGEILNAREKFQASLRNDDLSVQDILRVGTSAGGAKPKAIIAWNEKTNEVRSGQVKAPEFFSYWLLKFDGVSDNRLNDNPLGIGKIEYAYYRMASDCGIKMSDCRLLPDGKYSHFMTRRFDRRDDGTKLHVQTLCAIAHFNRDGRYSYEQAFQVMRRLHLPDGDMDQFYRRMVFNVVARNHDDHTKNHAFLMNDSGEWELGPAYDLCYSYSPTGKWTSEHQMSVNNKRSGFEYADLIAVSKNMGIRSAKEIIDQVNEVVSRWSDYARDAGVQQEYAEEIGRNLRLSIINYPQME